MKAMVSRKELLNAAMKVERFAAKKSSRSVLTCLQVTADEELILAGTDLEITARKPVDAQVEIGGASVVPAKQLLQTLSVLKDEIISLESEDNNLHIKGAKSNITLFGEKPEDFPCVELPSAGPCIVIDAPTWYEMVRKTMFAASESRTRYALNGGFLQWSDKRLRLVATDGKRLAIITRKAKPHGRQPKRIKEGMIIPAAFFNKTQQIAKKAEQVQLNHHASEEGSLEFLSADFGDITVTARMLEGHFPDYNAVIPPQFQTTMTIGVKDFDQALQETMLVTEPRDPFVKLSLNSVCMIISAHSEDRGKAEVTLIPKIKGEELEFGVNPHYMLDFLHLFKNGNAQIKFSGNDSAMVITHEKDEAYKYILMPHAIA